MTDYITRKEHNETKDEISKSMQEDRHEVRTLVQIHTASLDDKMNDMMKLLNKLDKSTAVRFEHAKDNEIKLSEIKNNMTDISRNINSIMKSKIDKTMFYWTIGGCISAIFAFSTYMFYEVEKVSDNIIKINTILQLSEIIK